MIFGFLPQNLRTKAVAVAFIMSWRQNGDVLDEALGRLAESRRELYRLPGHTPRRPVRGLRRVGVPSGADADPGEAVPGPECRRSHGGLELRRGPGCLTAAGAGRAAAARVG